MNKKYRVVFLGLINNKDEFTHSMSKFGVKPQLSETIVKKAPVILKENLPLSLARQYADIVQSAGGRVNIQSHGLFKEEKKLSKVVTIEPLDHFTVCPRCGHKQLKIDKCEKCGLVHDTE